MPKTRIKKKTNTTGGFQDLGYTLTDDEITKISEIDNKINKVSSTDNAIARFDGTTGVIQNSKVTITDAGDIYSNGTKVVVESALNGLATETFVTEKIAELVDSAPEELNTLNELAEGITANKGVLETVTDAIGNKAPNNHASTATTYGVATTSKYGHVKISNGDVNTVTSSNGVAAGMDHSHSNYVQTGRAINGKPLTSDVTLKLGDLENDVGYLTSYTETDPTVPSWAKAAKKPTYSYSEITGAPTALSKFTNDAGFITSTSLSGYVPTSRTINNRTLTTNITLTASDVGALPSSTTIPTVNNGTLTIQKNGTKVQTFTANQSTNVTANITVPTKTSDLTNDSGFITSSDLPASGVTSVVGQTGAITADQIKSGMLQQNGGFSIGEGSSAISSGVAIGYGAKATLAGAALGWGAETGQGGAVGMYATTTTGGAVGLSASSTTGFAGGAQAKATADGSVQLGEGTNSTANTLQFRGYSLLNSSGNIPKERLSSTSVTSVVGMTGDVTANQVRLGIRTDGGGIHIGTSSWAATGGAIGMEAKTQTGGAVGYNANSYDGDVAAGTGGAVGDSAYAGDGGGAVGHNAYVGDGGGAIGGNARTQTGGAVGLGAESVYGFAGGYAAKATADGAVQLGIGTNTTADTLQFRSYQLLDANGKIPYQRFSQNFVRLGSKRGKGTFTLSESLENFLFILLISINEAKDLYRGPTVIPVSWIKGIDAGTANYGKVFGIESWDGSRYRIRFNNATQGEITAEWYATDVTVYGIR